MKQRNPFFWVKQNFSCYNQNQDCNKFRTLTQNETNRIFRFINGNKIDEFDDWGNYHVDDGTEYQYLHCTNVGINTFYIYNPQIGLYRTLVDLFWELAETGEFEIIPT